MHLKCALGLVACTLLPTVSAQQTGVSHPDDVDGSIRTTVTTSSTTTRNSAAPAQTTGYAVPQAPAVLLEQQDAGTTATRTQTTVVQSAPAPIVQSVGAGSAATPATSTVVRAQAAPAQVTQVRVVTVTTAPTAPEPPDPDSGVISDEAALAIASQQNDALKVRTVPAPAQDADEGLILRREASPYELPEGSVLHVVLRNRLATDVTVPGAPFSAELSQPMAHDGIVLVPAHSVLTGRVTDVHGGARIRGAASLHLQPEYLTLPDGTSYRITGQVIDTDLHSAVHINSEGTIVRSSHVVQALASVGLVTGSAAVAGALVGGPIGAVVGAGVGAGVGTTVALRQDQQQVLDSGTGIDIALTAPLHLHAETTAALAGGR